MTNNNIPYHISAIAAMYDIMKIEGNIATGKIIQEEVKPGYFVGQYISNQLLQYKGYNADLGQYLYVEKGHEYKVYLGVGYFKIIGIFLHEKDKLFHTYKTEVIQMYSKPGA